MRAGGAAAVDLTTFTKGIVGHAIQNGVNFVDAIPAVVPTRVNGRAKHIGAFLAALGVLFAARFTIARDASCTAVIVAICSEAVGRIHTFGGNVVGRGGAALAVNVTISKQGLVKHAARVVVNLVDAKPAVVHARDKVRAKLVDAFLGAGGVVVVGRRVGSAR